MGDGGCAVIVSLISQIHTFQPRSASPGDLTATQAGCVQQLEPLPWLCDMEEPCGGGAGGVGRVAEQSTEEGAESSKHDRNVDSKRRRFSSRWDVTDVEYFRHLPTQTEVNNAANHVPALLPPIGESGPENFLLPGIQQGETGVLCSQIELHSGSEQPVTGDLGVSLEPEKMKDLSYEDHKRNTSASTPAGKWNAQDSACHTPSRCDRQAREENGEGHSYTGSSSDSHRERNVQYHHSERVSHDSRGNYHSRDKSHDGSVCFDRCGRSMNGNYNDRRSSERNNSRHQHERDYVDRNQSRSNLTNRQGNLRNSYNNSVERHYASGYESRKKRRESDHYEISACKGHARNTRNWEIKASNKAPNCSPDHNQSHSLFGSCNSEEKLALETSKDNTINSECVVDYKDDSGLVEKHSSISLQATFQGISERACEASCNGTIISALNKQTGPKEVEQKGWIYLDNKGNTCGPVELVVLKQLLENGTLQSDHLISIDGSNEWVTLEHAVSPVPTYTSIISEPNMSCLDESACPQRLLSVAIGKSHLEYGREEEYKTAVIDQISVDDDLRIDERVEHLMQGFILVPGKEKDVVSEALSHAVSVQLESEVDFENEESPRSETGLAAHWRDDQLVCATNILEGIEVGLQKSKEPAGVTANANYTVEGGCISSFQSTRKWTSRGGDWKFVREPESTSTIGAQGNRGSDRALRLKLVLNEGYPLYEVRQSGLLDPRRESSEPSNIAASQRRKLTLPPWVDRLHDVKTECFQKSERAKENPSQSSQLSIVTPTMQSKGSLSSTHMPNISTPPGVAGEKKMKPVAPTSVINLTGQQMESTLINSLPFLDCYSASVSKNNTKLSTMEIQTQEIATVDPHQASPNCTLEKGELDLQVVSMAISSVNISKQLIKKENLSLQSGEWYYKDGAGRENGPFYYAQLQLMVENVSLFDGMSIYRKSDDLWVPVYSSCQESFQENQNRCQEGADFEDSATFHQLYPQFMGYMCGKLHEHLMKSYRGRDFGATLHEGLEKRLNDKQHKIISEGPVSMGTHVTSQMPTSFVSGRPLESRSAVYNLNHKDTDREVHLLSAFIRNSGFSSSRYEQTAPSKTSIIDHSDYSKVQRVRKRRHLVDVGTSRIAVLEQSLQASVVSDSSLKGDALSLESDVETGSWPPMTESDKMVNWAALDSHILMRIFYSLRYDLKSLVFASTTCKSWRASFRNFMQEARQIDLSSLGNLCTDAVLDSFAGFFKRHTYKLSVKGCLALSRPALRSVLHQCVSMSVVDITGCDQLRELVQEFPRIKWIGPYYHDLPRKVKSLNLINERKVVPRRYTEGLQQANSSDDSVGKDRLIDQDRSAEHMDLDSSSSVVRSLEANHIMQSHHLAKVARLLIAEKPNNDSVSCQKLARRDCAISDFNIRGRDNLTSLKRKHKQVPSPRLGKTAHNCLSADRIAAGPPRSKGNSKNGDNLSADDTISSLDRHICHQMAQILKAVKEADTKKFFSHQDSDGKGPMPLVGRSLDLSAIEEKHKDRQYPGTMDGLRSFKDDLNSVCRKAFQCSQKSSPIFKAGEKIFKLVHRLVKELEDNVSKAHSGKDFYNNAHVKRVKGRSNHQKSISNMVGRFDRPKRERASRSKKQQPKDWEISDLEDEDNMFDDEDTDESELDIHLESEGDVTPNETDESSADEDSYSYWGSRQWGARMTKASMVPPVTRKYEVIEEYVPVIDEDEVVKKMSLELPEDYGNKLQEAMMSRGGEYSHLEIPELKNYKPRKRLGDEVLEQEVYGIDPYTYNLLLDTMPRDRIDFTDLKRQQLIEEELLRALNEEAKNFTGSGKAPMTYALEHVVQRLVEHAKDHATKTFCQVLLRNMQSRPKDKYVAYRKGLGVICNKQDGFEKDDFVVEFFGEVYPAWRWFEKQDAIRFFQKNEKEPAPEFYNIFLERPKGDAAGYDLVVVDAMHKANYASRICHSCRPNCEAKVTAVDGRYQIGVYTLRPVQCGEELTFDYNSVTESKEEYEASVCLCGSQGCRGSYLNLGGPETFQQVMKDSHGILDRHHLLLEACAAGPPTLTDWSDLRQAGLGSCLLEGLPDWTIGYAARLVRFINQERSQLPQEIIKHIVQERQLHEYGDQEMFEADVQADGVYNQRLQNLAITLDKVRYALKQVYCEAKRAPPPIRKVEPAELVSLVWKGENSVVVELLHYMENHLSKEDFIKFASSVHEHEPAITENIEENLRKSLLWLRDELCKASVTCLSRHDAAADVIHMYAYTKHFFTCQDSKSFESPPLTINSLDLGPKYAHILGSGPHPWRKIYGKDYVLGQLVFWHRQNLSDPGSSLVEARRGCLVLPDLSSCYARSLHPDLRISYGSRQRKDMFHRMETNPQKQWPKYELWEFKCAQNLFGTPMMDAIIEKSNIDAEMMDWLKKRGPWDD